MGTYRRRFRPKGTEAAFTIFHFCGMLGTSEAAAESVASVLKHYGGIQKKSSARTSRVGQKAFLKLNGITGTSADDTFIATAWLQYFGTSKLCHFRFHKYGTGARDWQ